MPVRYYYLLRTTHHHHHYALASEAITRYITQHHFKSTAYTSITNSHIHNKYITSCSVRVCIYNEHNIGTNTHQFVALSFSICTILGVNTTVGGTVVLI